MHEYGVAQALIEHADREARAPGALSVRRVVVRIGTLCAGADLTITGEDVVWRCDACGEPLPPGSALCCPGCSLPGRLAGGDALILERIEMELPAHV
jgi:Zn finger protein HypA/HybF involved in hydrogenase expression